MKTKLTDIERRVLAHVRWVTRAGDVSAAIKTLMDRGLLALGPAGNWYLSTPGHLALRGAHPFFELPARPVFYVLLADSEVLGIFADPEKAALRARRRAEGVPCLPDWAYHDSHGACWTCGHYSIQATEQPEEE